MYQINLFFMTPERCGTSTWTIRRGLKENSRFQIGRLRMTFFDCSQSVSLLAAKFGLQSKLCKETNSTMGFGPEKVSSVNGDEGIVVSTPGASLRRFC